MSVMFSEQLSMLTNAPGGIQKLRSLILELAVRGKLVAQDDNDESANELLQRIASERARLEAVGAGKKNKATLLEAEHNQPFNLPDSWIWAKFADVTSYVQRGKGPDYADQSDYLVISQKCVRWHGLDLSQARCITPESFSKYDAIRLLRMGDVLWNSTGTGTIGRAVVVPNIDSEKVLVADSHVTVVRPVLISPTYLWRWIQSPTVQREITGLASGSTNQIELATSTILMHPLPLPPLAEQHRIVSKVNELMTLCDQLESEQADAEATHTRLVGMLLDKLSESNDADLAINWKRTVEHFESSFSNESSVEALKKTILQLGVNGRLTNTRSFEQLKLGDLVIEASYGTSKKCDSTKTNGACPVLRIPNVVRETLDLADLKFSVLEDKELKKVLLEEGDILLVRTNGSAELVGRCAVVKGLRESVAFASYMIRLRFDPLRVDPEFAQRVLRNHRLQNRMIDFARTTAGQFNVSIGRLRELEMHVPSLAEQQRIVKKIDELMTLCDQLKVDLAESRSRQERLASVLIESALKAA